ncbi:hypothetical protein DMENIID0001_123900 [Sergentomyia squamirostris]
MALWAFASFLSFLTITPCYSLSDHGFWALKRLLNPSSSVESIVRQGTSTVDMPTLVVVVSLQLEIPRTILHIHGASYKKMQRS